MTTRRERMNTLVSSLLGKVLGVHQESMTGAEIGVWRGELSEHLLGCFGGLRLLMVDPYVTYEGSRVGKRQQWLTDAKEEAERRTEPFSQRRVLIQKKSEEAAEEVADVSLDFVFIDGDHRYEAVLKDLECWVPKVRDNGLVFGHDFKDRTDFGVKQALFQFTKRRFPVSINVADARIEGVWWFVKQRGLLL